MKRSRSLVVVCLGWLVVSTMLAGCGGAPARVESKPEPAPSASTSAREPAPEPEAPPAPKAPETPVAPDPPLPQAGPPEVKLLEPGAEPRRAIRYAFQKKAEPALMDLKLSLNLGSGPAGIAMPTLRIFVDLTPTNVEPDGSATISFDAKKVEVQRDEKLSDAQLKKLESEMQKMVGLKGRTVVSARGIAKETTIEPPAQTSPETLRFLDSIKESMRDISFAFPEEPIGKGAKWEVKSVSAGAITIVQTARYTLKDATKTTATFDIEVTQSAPPQTLKTPAGMPQGASMRVLSHDGKGTGTATVTFARVTPVSQMKVSTVSHMELHIGDMKKPTDIGAEITMSFKPGK